MSMSEFLDMGGYGLYVWSSYGIALLVFGGLFVGVKLQRKRLIKQLRRLYRQQAKINTESQQ